MANVKPHLESLMKRRIFAALLLIVFTVLPAIAAESFLKPNDTVAIAGDSITEQKEYSVFIQDYLLMCQPAPNLRTTQFGWSGETAPGFLSRMANDVLWLKPSVATTCYGMNDGGYSPIDDAKAKRYKNAQRGIVQLFKGAGTRLIIIGSPGVVDADTYRNNPEQAAMYNKTLAAFRDISQETARQETVAFANVFDAMMAAMTKAKAKYGPKYHVAGGDGVHPDKNGQLIMAYAFLKAMGCDGNIGSITVDLAANTASASDGHKVLSSQAPTIELESSRYPFCFFGNPSSPSSTAGIIEFFPFNDDLNRLTLIVKNPGADRLKITWGQSTREFPAADLAKGVNLAAEFLDNPFCDPFRKVEQAIRAQQNYETQLHKQLMHDLPTYRNAVPDESDAIDRIAAAVQRKDAVLAAVSAAAVIPVKHTIKIEPAK